MNLLFQLAFWLTLPGSIQSSDCSLTVEVQGLRNQKGELRIALFRGEPGFPNDSQRAYQKKVAKISGETVEVRFANLPAGEYAFCLLHDENSNGEMDYNWLMMPKEGYACSNDAAGKVKRPNFANARFQVSEPGHIHSVKMTYW